MPPPTLEARLTRLRRALTEPNLDALLLTDIDNVGYVSGFSGSTAYALVTPDGGRLPHRLPLHPARPPGVPPVHHRPGGQAAAATPRQ